MAGCATAPSGDPNNPAGPPLAAVHSDLTFMLITGPRLHSVCAEAVACASPEDGAPPTPFAAQVQRVAEVLQQGALRLYPDLGLRVQGIADSGFDVYVAAGNEPGSVSSASGRIALNAALGVEQPYDDWLAFVIAREMGHVIARHHEDNSSTSMAISLFMNIVLPGSGLLKSAASMIGAQLAVGSQREQQAMEADAIAVDLLQAAGFRLHDVALSLAVAPAVLDDGSWSQGFRKSSATVVAAARGSKFAAASVPTPSNTPP